MLADHGTWVQYRRYRYNRVTGMPAVVNLIWRLVGILNSLVKSCALLILTLKSSLLKNRKAWRKVIETCDAAIKLEPRSALSYAFRGHAYGALGEYDKAIEDSDKAANLNSAYVPLGVFKQRELNAYRNFVKGKAGQAWNKIQSSRLVTVQKVQILGRSILPLWLTGSASYENRMVDLFRLFKNTLTC